MTHDEIAQEAYRIWQEKTADGMPDDPEGNWREAEATVIRNEGE